MNEIVGTVLFWKILSEKIIACEVILAKTYTSAQFLVEDMPKKN